MKVMFTSLKKIQSPFVCLFFFLNSIVSWYLNTASVIALEYCSSSLLFIVFIFILSFYFCVGFSFTCVSLVTLPVVTFSGLVTTVLPSCFLQSEFFLLLFIIPQDNCASSRDRSLVDTYVLLIL